MPPPLMQELEHILDAVPHPEKQKQRDEEVVRAESAEQSAAKLVGEKEKETAMRANKRRRQGQGDMKAQKLLEQDEGEEEGEGDEEGNEDEDEDEEGGEDEGGEEEEEEDVHAEMVVEEHAELAASVAASSGKGTRGGAAQAGQRGRGRRPGPGGAAAGHRPLQTFVFSATLTLPLDLRKRLRKGGGGPGGGSATLETLMDRWAGGEWLSGRCVWGGQVCARGWLMEA